MQVPKYELEERMRRFRERMDTMNPDWKIAAFIGKINLFYFTGTMQEGMLLIPRNDDAVFWVRRSYERAITESLFPIIKPMNSFRDAAKYYPVFPNTIYLETDILPIAMVHRIQKYFPFTNIKAVDAHALAVRSIKSPFELSLMEKSGKIHRHVLEDLTPLLLKEGMSEAELATKLFSTLISEGHHGVSRFGMFETEVALGHVAFGESSIYPTYFNGPGGNYGMNPAVPFLGSRTRTLQKGDLVFIDIGCGFEGYHTDKTHTYMFGKSLPDEAIRIHNHCVEIQNQIAEMLKPGAIPSQIYDTIISNQTPDFLKNFMGYGTRQVRFLGHGIGLTIDETPVIAKGFDDPIQEGMVFAIEPKKGIPDIGMVGIENTFVVTKEGGRSITGTHPGLIPVY
ncbi:MAG: Xaa-Pro peptidase family protein [Bacteroidota bacterium]|nr:Xaa-Pro peptidase family protein [Bacteroidota bacterium]